VKRGEGLFEPREVRVGARAGDEVAIAENLAAGDTVVASANFLIDSEANLMAFMGGMLGMGMRADQMRMGTGDMEEMDGMQGMDGANGPNRMDGPERMDGLERMEGMEGMDGMDGSER
jgi:hypothetical protein